MKINEVVVRRQTTGLEDLYKSSPEAKIPSGQEDLVADNEVADKFSQGTGDADSS